MAMYIEKSGVVCDTSKRSSLQRSAAFVGLAVTSRSYVFCTFQIGPAKNSPESSILIFRSSDQGETWMETGCRFNPVIAGVSGSYSSGEIIEVEPGRLLLFATWFDRSDPERPLFDPVTHGILHSKNLVAESTDHGDTWSAWRELDLGGLKGCSSTGPVLQWSDGRIAYPFESYKDFDDPRPATHGAWLLVSKDRGCTFDRPFSVARHPESKIYYWDQRHCAGKVPGEFTALFWTHDLVAQRDLTVHLRHGSIDRPSAADMVITPTAIPGQIASPLWLEDGRLLAFVVDRDSPGTLKIWSSRDEGRTWRDALLVYTHEERAALTQGKDNVNFEQYWADMRKWSFGHPALRSLGGNIVLAAFYAGPPNNMSVHWVRLDVSE